jgi:hypothetical protein
MNIQVLKYTTLHLFLLILDSKNVTNATLILILLILDLKNVTNVTCKNISICPETFLIQLHDNWKM